VGIIVSGNVESKTLEYVEVSQPAHVATDTHTIIPHYTARTRWVSSGTSASMGYALANGVNNKHTASNIDNLCIILVSVIVTSVYDSDGE
jgi:hypothetical protein